MTALAAPAKAKSDNPVLEASTRLIVNAGTSRRILSRSAAVHGFDAVIDRIISARSVIERRRGMKRAAPARP